MSVNCILDGDTKSLVVALWATVKGEIEDVPRRRHLEKQLLSEMTKAVQGWSREH